MAKKKEPVVGGEEEVQTQKEKPVKKDSIVYVNPEKFGRAQIIVDLVSGKRLPANDQESARKESLIIKFAEADVSPKGDAALRFAYETLLGGLVRTESEQVEADENAAEKRAKLKKKPVQE